MAGSPKALLLLAFVVVVGALLRLYRLDAHSLSLDEIGHVLVARRPLGDGFLAAVAGHAGAAPLDYVGLKLTAKLFGVSTAAVRLWPWFVGSLGVAAIAWLAWELFRSKWTAVLAAALLAIAPLHVYYAREVRFWALSVLLSLLILVLFARAVQNGSRWRWAAFGAAVAVGLYGHYFTAFVSLACALAIGVAVVWDVAMSTQRRAALARWVPSAAGVSLALVGAGLAFLPWYLYAIAPQLGSGLGAALPPLSADRADEIIASVLFPVPVLPPGPEAMVVVRSLELLALVGLVAAGPFRRPATLAVGLVAIGILPAVWLADSFAGYFFHARQLVVLVACVALLGAAGIVAVTALAGRVAARWRPLFGGAVAVASTALVIGMAVPLSGVYAGTIHTKEDWRGAAELINDQVCDDGRVIVNISHSYAHGVGYYAPELESRALYLPTPPGDTLLETLRETHLRQSDWVVVLVYAARVGNVESIVHEMRDRGYEVRTFTWLLLVFTPPETC